MLFYFFKHAGLFVLSYVVPAEVAAIHGNIDTGRKCLYKGEGASEVEESVGATKLNRDHCAEQNDRLVLNSSCQYFRCFAHRIGAMSDDNLGLFTLFTLMNNQIPVLVRHFKTIDHHQGPDFRM